ncbi:MAG: enoyl-CoA hydratase/isomerase family protein [Candidatus Krumholzibacteriia bacterium]
MNYEHFGVDIRDGAARLTLDGPANPPLGEFGDEFLDLMLRLQEDNAVRAILVTDGEHAFDLQHDFAVLGEEITRSDGFGGLAAWLELSHRMITAIQECAKPVVTATRGDVRGLGLGFFMSGDVRLAASTASFTAPDLTKGLMPDWGLTHTLPRLLSPGRALEFLWSGRTMPASEAYFAGLIDRVLEESAYEEIIEGLLERLARLPQPLARLTKLANQQSDQFDLTSMLSFEFEAQQQCWESRESIESLAAWQENRTPVFHAPTTPEDDE